MTTFSNITQARYVEVLFDSRDSDNAPSSYTGNAGTTGSPDNPIFGTTQFSEKLVGLKVLELSVPASYYTLNSSNNKFAFTSASGNKNFTLAQGNYAGTEFATALATAMTTADGTVTFTATYSAITNKITLTFSGGGTFQFNKVGTTGFVFLGIQSGDADAAAAVSPWVSPFPINLGGDSTLVLRSPELGPQLRGSLYSSSTTASTNDILCKFPINCNRNEWITWQNPTFQFFSVPAYLLNRVSFSITTDQSLSPLQFNGLSFQVKLALLFQNASNAGYEQVGQSIMLKSYPQAF
jgi:hypothetical protein